jgi:putative SOS response-associated peptidase YedK
MSVEVGQAVFIPASGFYEWTGGKKDRQPHLFTAADGAPVLAFAGLWDRWRDPVAAEEVVGREQRGSPRDSWGLRRTQVFAFAKLLSGAVENLANPRPC